jgi:hypothetical protein
MYTIRINERTATKNQMASILRDIANELDRGKSFGDEDEQEWDWALIGEEYVPPVSKPIRVLPVGFTDEDLKTATREVFAETGSKLEAVKFVKVNANLGLKEAKDYCDELL